jgi:hypothetical protein
MANVLIMEMATIDLGNGAVTPGIENSLKKLKKLGIPANQRRMTVLDIIRGKTPSNCTI